MGSGAGQGQGIRPEYGDRSQESRPGTHIFHMHTLLYADIWTYTHIIYMRHILYIAAIASQRQFWLIINLP